MTVSSHVADGANKAVARLYNALMTGLLLTLITKKGSDAARLFMFSHFRRLHLEKFLPGLQKLGLDKLPHAVACAQYHYFSNALGGVKTEYICESDRKAWVRYPPPRWIWQGTAICAVPREVNEAMLHGWHGHNGVSLGNPRLGFVCTGQTVEGDPGLEGYYYEYDRDLGADERVRFVSDERALRFDPGKAPALDSASWPEVRRLKIERSYAMEYVRTLVPTLIGQFGTAEANALLARTARLVGMQLYDETAQLMEIERRDADAFARYLVLVAQAQGEDVSLDRDADCVIVRQIGWKLMKGIAEARESFEAWNALWAGALAVHDRFLRLETKVSGDATVTWRIDESRLS